MAGLVLVFAGLTALSQDRGAAPAPPAAAPSIYTHPVDTAAVAYTAVVQRVCVICHNDRLLTGNLTLAKFDVAKAPQNAETAEKMIRKLRAGMMPPPGMPRPGADTLSLLAGELETRIDAVAAANPNPGGRTFQRLNRAEYERSIRDLLVLDVNAGDYLPLDTKSANFDNIADVQTLSPTLLEAYFRAAAEISRLAVGNPDATASEATYKVARWVSQTDHVEGAPFGTRGGASVVHTFPADGQYVFRVSFHHETTGALVGNGRSALQSAEIPEQLEISIDGARAALLEVDRWMHVGDPNGVNMRTDPVFVHAGPHRVSAAFIRRAEGPVQDLVSPHDWSLTSTAIAGTYGIMSLPHLRDLVIGGPYHPTGVSDTPSRQRIFACRPTSSAEARPCAEQIVSRLGARAYRRPFTADDLKDLMAFYQSGAAEGGFEVGVRTALEAMLASPHFVFRFEEPPPGARPGQGYRINDLDLASRLSFFLWAAPPDDELLALARRGGLSEPAALEQQVRRMLLDPRSEALGPRFAGQWLRLQDLEKIHPDVRTYPDFDEQLKDAMRHETELFFNSLVREDRSMLDLFTADYTFVNERLATHYGIPGVTGDAFRRATYPDPRRRGVLGQGSVLTLTSHAGRTSPVLRGKWVMEVFLGTPPPPPPPGVPDLEQTEEAKEGRLLTTRERMEMHRANPVCSSCHQFMDPIGLALDNFDVTGRWRIKENGMPLDTRGRMYDGTDVQNPADLRQALLQRPTPLLRTFTVNLMAYALGRRVEPYDMPAVRAIVKNAEAEGYRMSAFILGVVKSDAFQKNKVAVVEDQ
jgi:mono/diheme cytochrome c family protein